MRENIVTNKAGLEASKPLVSAQRSRLLPRHSTPPPRGTPHMTYPTCAALNRGCEEAFLEAFWGGCSNMYRKLWGKDKSLDSSDSKSRNYSDSMMQFKPKLQSLLDLFLKSLDEFNLIS